MSGEAKHLPLYQVDAFTERRFCGNPAAVCLLTEPLADEVLRSIAAEMNLSETAFLTPLDGDYSPRARAFRLRWFTPLVEVPLCGHATLATTKVLFDELGIEADAVSYTTLSGILKARRDAGGIALDFPLDEPVSVPPVPELLAALGITDYEQIVLGKTTRKLVVQVADAAAVSALNPDFGRLRSLAVPWGIKGVGVTAPAGPKYDFISRYFNPWAGVDEDPVTGSVHTLLARFWADKLDKTELRAYQASARGGEILLRLIPSGRVELVGQATIIFRGQLVLTD